MKNLKRILSIVLAMTMLLALSTAAFAADSTGYSDVAANAWYVGAVAYVTDNGLMNGTGTAQFSPNEPTNLAMLLTILHCDGIRGYFKPLRPNLRQLKIRGFAAKEPICLLLLFLLLPILIFTKTQGNKHTNGPETGILLRGHLID